MEMMEVEKNGGEREELLLLVLGEEGGGSEEEYYNNNNNNNKDEKEKGGWRWRCVRRRMKADSHFFASGNFHRELLFAKQIALDISEDQMKNKQQQQQLLHPVTTTSIIMEEEEQLLHLQTLRDTTFCPIVGCGARLESLDSFEDHYNARHMASCSTCSRVFPTYRLLSIHVSESHDSFFQAKVARGFPMYECLVESCGMKLKSYKSRQQHLVDKHNFPSSFEFLKKSQPSKKHRKKTQKKGAQVHKNKEEEVSSAMQVEEETLNGLVSAVSKLSTSDSSPSSVSFGRRHTRGLTFVPRAVQRVERPQ